MSSSHQTPQTLKRRRSLDAPQERPTRTHKRIKETASPNVLYDPSQQEAVLRFERHHVSRPTQLVASLRISQHLSPELERCLEEVRYAQTQLGDFGADLTLQELTRRGTLKETAIGISGSQTIAHHDYKLPASWTRVESKVFSPKLLRLVQALKSSDGTASRFQGIIYVNRRSFAPMLACTLSKLSEHLNSIRPCYLLGSNSPSGILADIETLHKLRIGTFNLIVAARSAEDLDLPDVPLLIHYDPPPTILSYAYCRTQTQALNGHMIFMLEDGCNLAYKDVNQSALLSEEACSWIESARGASTSQSFSPRELCNFSPAMSLVDTSDDEQRPLRIQDPATGLTITPLCSTLAIHRYALYLHGQKASELCSISFQEQSTHEGIAVLCTINLPGSPIPNTVGPPSPSHGHARRSATYEACLQLFQAGHLESWVFPALNPLEVGPHIRSEPNTNDVDSTRGPARKYPRKHPLFWTEVLPIHEATTVYPTLISPSSDCSPSYPPVLLLTTRPLPNDLGPSARMYGSSVPSDVHLITATPFTFTAEELEKLHQFTRRVYHAVLRKALPLPFKEVMYLLAPLDQAAEELCVDATAEMQGLISWDVVEEAAKGWAVPFYKEGEQLSQSMVEDAVLADSWTEFTRRYHDLKIRSDLTPRSAPAHGEFGPEHASYLAFCEKQRKDFTGLKDPDQPLIEVTDLPQYPNSLCPLQKPVAPTTRCFIPELCARFTIPAGTFRTLNLVPAVTYHIDQLFLVKELNAKYFGRVISDELLLQAITSPTALRGYDYERLEWLGDAFLKYFSSCFLFSTHPKSAEGQLHTARGALISNNTLFLAANRMKIPQFIQSAAFVLRTWKPVLSSTSQGQGSFKPPVNRQPEAPNTSKRSKKRRAKDPNTIVLGDNVVANVVEAIIGAAFLTGGRDVALTVTKALDLPFPNVYRWADVTPVVPAFVPAPVQARQRDAIVELTRCGSFEDGSPWLAFALSRGSNHESHLAHERLEFIGDAILDFLVVCYLYDKYPSMSTGGLTLLKGASVSNTALAAISASIGLHTHARFEDPRTHQKVSAYVAQVTAHKTKAAAEGHVIGQYWIGLEPPKALADILEALIGAIYLSDASDLHGVQRFFDRVLRPFYDEHVTLHTLSDHPHSALTQVMQSYPCREFKVDSSSSSTDANSLGSHRCSVIVHDVVLARAEGASAALASRWACSFALDALEGDPTFLARTCDCRQGASANSGQEAKSRKAGGS